MNSITTRSSELQMLVNNIINMKFTAWHARHAMHASTRHCTAKSGGPLLRKQESLLISFKPSVGGPQMLSKFIFIIILPSLLSYFAVIRHYTYHHPFLGSLLLVSNMLYFLFFLLPHFHLPSLPSSSLLAVTRNAMPGGTASLWGLPLFRLTRKASPSLRAGG